MSRNQAMRYLSICSGIEAATAGWEPLGWEAVAFAEVDKFPSAVLAHHYPEVPNLGDMTAIKGDDYRGSVDLLVGGTPCQSFSVAGLRGGLDDHRGQLSLAYFRLAGRIRPRWVVWENVPGVLSDDGGRTFGTVLGALAELGYGFAYRILDAQWFGVPQRRRRVFLVGYLGDCRPAAAVLFERHSLSGDTPPSRKAGQKIAETITRRAFDGGQGGTHGGGGNHFIADIAGSLTARYRRSGGASNDDISANRVVTQALTCRLGDGGPDDNKAQGGFYVPAIVNQVMSCKWAKGTSGPTGDEYHNLVAPPVTHKAYADHTGQGLSIRGREGGSTAELSGEVATALRASKGGGDKAHVLHNLAVRRLIPRECERLQGFPDDYTLIPWRGKAAPECPDGPRYKALGNSMCVNVMKWIGERIKQVEAILLAHGEG